MKRFNGRPRAPSWIQDGTAVWYRSRPDCGLAAIVDGDPWLFDDDLVVRLREVGPLKLPVAAALCRLLVRRGGQREADLD